MSVEIAVLLSGSLCNWSFNSQIKPAAAKAGTAAAVATTRLLALALPAGKERNVQLRAPDFRSHAQSQQSERRGRHGRHRAEPCAGQNKHNAATVRHVRWICQFTA